MIIKGDNFNEIILYEYLESTGTLYINTGVKNFNNTINYFIDFQYTNLTGRQLNGTDNGFYVGINNGKWEVDYQNYFGTCDTNRHTIEQKGYITNNVFEKEVYLDNSLIAISLQSLNISTAVKDNINIFGLKNLLYSRERIYSSNIVVDGVLVRDFVPVTYNGTPGLWDKVELRFYGNSGTGNFILGPKKTDTNSIIKRYIGSNEVKKIYIGENLIWENLPYDTEIEYLQSPSDNNEYMTTNIYPTQYSHLVVDALILDTTSSGNIGTLLGVNYRFHCASIYLNKFHFGTGNSWINTTNVDTNRHTFELYGSGIAKIDNTSYNLSSGLSGSTIYPLYIFAVNDNNITYSKSFRIYSLKFYEGNELILDLIPICIESKGGLYNKVTNTIVFESSNYILGPSS